MKDYLEFSNKKLEDIVIMVRGQLPKMARITLEALIVIDVHGKTNKKKLQFINSFNQSFQFS